MASRHPNNSAPALAMSIAAFCESIGICRASFYGLVRRGEAPPLIRIGHRLVIRHEAAEAWLRARETATM